MAAEQQRPTAAAPPRKRALLAPVAYSESLMPSLGLARSSRSIRRIANWLCWTLLGVVLLMAFAPWQQSVTGTGTTLAFAPDARQQVIESPIKGRIARWGDGVVENARVSKDQVIAEIRDLDESYSARLEEQLQNYRRVVEHAQSQLEANQRALEDSIRVVVSYQNQVRAYETVKEETIGAQDAFVQMAEEKIKSEQQQLAEYEAAIPELQPNYDRLKVLYAEGNIALAKFQEAEAKLNATLAKMRKAAADVEAARADLKGKVRDRLAKIEKAQAEIEYARAALDEAEYKVSKAESDVEKSRQELNKANTDLLDMQVKVARQDTQIIKAPFDGYLVKISPNLNTAVLKEGDPICTIVPDTADRSVQIWLSGNDAPLVEPGRHVRLQFEGWPAVQFAGWPSVAVGTFGGQVASVDAIDDGKGKFRVLIQPDPTDRPWPQDRFLRQGVRTNGWVLLNQVPLWYEVWRRLNGFPPVVSVDEPVKDDLKVPKLPK